MRERHTEMGAYCAVRFTETQAWMFVLGGGLRRERVREGRGQRDPHAPESGSPPS